MSRRESQRRASSSRPWAFAAGLFLAACTGRVADGVGAARSEVADPARERREEERMRMVDRQIAARGVRDEAVLDAMRRVPRHLFVPASEAESAYEDRPLAIGRGQTISQPYIVAVMTEALELTPESKVLEIGTGSGYQAAVLREITPHVFTIEIVDELARRAAFDLAAAGYDDVHARIGDGYRGWPEEAPFDAIVVTAAPDHVPEALVEQLAPGGRLVIPVGEEAGSQELLRIRRDPDGTVRSEWLAGVRFVPMTGAARDAR